MHAPYRSVLSASAALLVSLVAHAASTPPSLRQQGTATQLMIDGAPFFIRGGEVGNSSGEAAYLRPFWPKLRAMHLNTVLVPVYWDQIEPEEGKLDFRNIDTLIRDARENGVRLGLLWFGTWKNSMSCYVPAWVKRDPARFPRARDAAGVAQEILTPFADSNWKADARVFAVFMEHLSKVDPEHTVALIQVENEIGMIPSARDHSDGAERAFGGPVPQALIDRLVAHEAELTPELRGAWQAAGRRKGGTWTEVFGPGAATDEFFMAWYYARYVEAVASAGKARYPLPMYVNAALIRPGYQPGQYPSAGPLPHLVDIWHTGAPSIDLLAPDIYFPEFAAWTGRYAAREGTLFVPEVKGNTDAAMEALYVIGAHQAIGFSPFAIESLDDTTAAQVGAAYEAIANVAPVIFAHEGKSAMAGFLPATPDNTDPVDAHLGKWIMHARFERAPAPDGGQTLAAGGFVIQVAENSFLFVGQGLTVTFDPAESGWRAGIESVDEGVYVKGDWKHLRWLNGDQTHQGRHVRMEPGRISMQQVTLYRYR